MLYSVKVIFFTSYTLVCLRNLGQNNEHFNFNFQVNMLNIGYLVQNCERKIGGMY